MKGSDNMQRYTVSILFKTEYENLNREQLTGYAQALSDMMNSNLLAPFAKSCIAQTSYVVNDIIESHLSLEEMNRKQCESEDSDVE